MATQDKMASPARADLLGNQGQLALQDLWVSLVHPAHLACKEKWATRVLDAKEKEVKRVKSALLVLPGTALQSRGLAPAPC